MNGPRFRDATVIAGVTIIIWAAYLAFMAVWTPVQAAPAGPQWYDAGAGVQYVDLANNVRCYTTNNTRSTLSCVVVQP